MKLISSIGIAALFLIACAVEGEGLSAEVAFPMVLTLMPIVGYATVKSGILE